MTLPPIQLNLCGKRFSVAYELTGSRDDAWNKAQDICVEQTIEFPADLLPGGDIAACIVGQVESFAPVRPGYFEAVISFALEIAHQELIQLLNVVFGNISLKPGMRVQRLILPPELLAAFRGPRFGRAGLRSLLGVPERPLLCTAIKPLGLSVQQLAHLAYQFALGGIDVIKDDHGLGNQVFAPFRERVQRCAEAVDRANRQTGLHCIYVPSIIAPADQLLERALWAKQAGAGGLLVAPGLNGFDSMRQLADDDRLALPIFSHPSLQGSFVTHPDDGISPYALFGQIARLAGADASIFPHQGGRFSFSLEDCRAVADGTRVPMAHVQPIFPTPAGGMTLERVSDMLNVYGREVVLLIGGSLHRHGPDLVKTCSTFRESVESW